MNKCYIFIYTYIFRNIYGCRYLYTVINLQRKKIFPVPGLFILPNSFYLFSIIQRYKGKCIAEIILTNDNEFC